MAANSFFDWVVSTVRFVPRDTARAEDVNSALDEVSNGFTDVEVKTDAAIKLQDGETAPDLGSAAARKGTVLSFNASTGLPEAAIATTDVSTVAGSIANVDAVGADIANVNTVATNIAGVNTAAANIASINNAASNASAAAASAIAAAASASDADASAIAAAASAASIDVAADIHAADVAAIQGVDEFGFADASASYVLKRVTLNSIKATIFADPVFTGTISSGNIVMSGASACIEMGQGGASNTPYFDWHSSATLNDYDYRMIVSGGTAVNGKGVMDVYGLQTNIHMHEDHDNNGITGIRTATFYQQADLATTTGAVTIDWTAAQNYRQIEPTGAITYTFTAPNAPCHLQLLVASDGTSSAFTHVFPGSVIWMGATWAQVANKAAIINFWYDGNGNYFAMGVNRV